MPSSQAVQDAVPLADQRAICCQVLTHRVVEPDLLQGIAHANVRAARNESNNSRRPRGERHATCRW